MGEDICRAEAEDLDRNGCVEEMRRWLSGVQNMWKGTIDQESGRYEDDGVEISRVHMGLLESGLVWMSRRIG
jgi:hypothetical protein